MLRMKIHIHYTHYTHSHTHTHTLSVFLSLTPSPGISARRFTLPPLITMVPSCTGSAVSHTKSCALVCEV